MSNETRILTCVYCGHEYPQNTPAHGAQVLTDHIRICAKHPLRKAEADIAMLRAALVRFVGADTREGLKDMETVVGMMPASDEQQTAMEAIKALLATLPEVRP